MARFKHTDNSQGQFIAVNLAEQLMPGTFEWTLDLLLNEADLSLFENKYNNDEKGASAYPPKVLLKVILYCYSRGIITSRKIEKACKENIIVMALAESCAPDHDTIATFISTNNEAISDLFAQILLKCYRLKLITGEMFAIDGCKLPSNASKEWSGTHADLKKKHDKLEKYIQRIISQHKELDKNANVKKIQNPYRKTMGDDKERRDKSIKRLKKKLKSIERFLAESEPKRGPSGEIQSNITDNESARIKSPHGYIQGYNGIAISDAKNQVIVCAEAIGSGPEAGCFPSMLNNLEKTMQLLTNKDTPLKKSLLEGDTGYFSEENLQAAAKKEIEVLIPDPQFRQRDPHFAEKKKEKVPKKQRFTPEDFTYNKKDDSFTCPAGHILKYKCDVKLRNNEGKQYRASRLSCRNCPLLKNCINVKTSRNPFRTLYVIKPKFDENLSDKMRKKIDNPAYRELYSKRMQIIEPVFSNITYCKGMNRFTLRTKKKVTAQWKLYCMVHNIGKCIKPLAEKYGT